MNYKYQQTADAEQITRFDTYAKVFGGVIAGLGTLLGLPLTILQFRKTRAEIRKLELEADSLRAKNLSTDAVWEGHRVIIDNSDYATVQILADPRFLGPLLLLLDFVFAWIILSLAGYALETFLPMNSVIRTLRNFIMGVVAVILLVPIAREARRVKKVLRPHEETKTKESGTNQ